jgi:hypothetical protein
MALVGVGMFLLGLAMSVGLIVTHAPGELLAVVYLVAGGIGALAMVRVIKHYETVGERREREEMLLR